MLRHVVRGENLRSDLNKLYLGKALLHCFDSVDFLEGEKSKIGTGALLKASLLENLNSMCCVWWWFALHCKELFTMAGPFLYCFWLV